MYLNNSKFVHNVLAWYLNGRHYCIKNMVFSSRNPVDRLMNELFQVKDFLWDMLNHTLQNWMNKEYGKMVFYGSILLLLTGKQPGYHFLKLGERQQHNWYKVNAFRYRFSHCNLWKRKLRSLCNIIFRLLVTLAIGSSNASL